MSIFSSRVMRLRMDSTRCSTSSGADAAGRTIAKAIARMVSTSNALILRSEFVLCDLVVVMSSLPLLLTSASRLAGPVCFAICGIAPFRARLLLLFPACDKCLLGRNALVRRGACRIPELGDGPGVFGPRRRRRRVHTLCRAGRAFQACRASIRSSELALCGLRGICLVAVTIRLVGMLRRRCLAGALLRGGIVLRLCPTAGRGRRVRLDRDAGLRFAGGALGLR